MSFCTKCGSKISEDDNFCPECGEPVSRAQDDEELQNEAQNKPKSHKALIVLLSIFILLLIMCIAGVITYIFMNENSTILKESLDRQNAVSLYTPPPSAPVPSASVTPSVKTHSAKRESEATPAVTGSEYSVFYDREYNFSCAYPTGFKQYNDNTMSGRYSLKSADGKGTFKICASKNSTNITSEQSISVFKSKCGGLTDYESKGDRYYAVRMKNSGMCYYKYLQLANGNMYWFEFEYPEEQEDIYDEYVNYIYKSFTIN